MTDHDAEIVKAAERWADESGRPGSGAMEAAAALSGAIRAKREAERPTLLTAEQARAIWSQVPYDAFGNVPLGPVLAADRASVLHMIEHGKLAKIMVDNEPLSQAGYVSVAELRRILTEPVP